MAATLDQAEPGDASGRSASVGRVTLLLLAPLSVAAALAAIGARGGGLGGSLGWVGLTLAWATAGFVLLRQLGSERLGMLAIWFSFLAGVAALAAALTQNGSEIDASTLLLALAVALLPAAMMHVLLALPSGALAAERTAAVVAGYLISVGVGVFLWTERPSFPASPIVIEAAIATGVGINGVVSRYRLAQGPEHRQIRWVALSLTAALEVLLVGLTLHVLLGWPAGVLEVAAAATIPIPLGLLLERSRRLHGAVDRLLVHAISLVTLTAVVTGIYLLVLGWLGHSPTEKEQTLVALSIVAAAISAVTYQALRKRAAGVARGLVDAEPEKAKAILDQLQRSTQEALESFRNLSHGIYPPLLQDRGLAEALSYAARGAPIATRIEATDLSRFDPEVEATVYFCCLEALQNAAKHAGQGARATVRVWEGEGGLLFEVVDDGDGFASEHGRRGAGITNMQDRLGAIRGDLRIESAPGRGTRVIGTIPLDS